MLPFARQCRRVGEMLRHLAIVILIVTGCGCKCSADEIVTPVPDTISTPAIVWPTVSVIVQPEQQVVPTPVEKIAVGEFLTIGTADRHFVRTFPDGLIRVTYAAGPVLVPSRGPDGEIVLTTHSSPHIYFLSPVKPGTVCVDMVPIGVSVETDIARHVLTVIDGTKPKPPPDPDDPIVPDPPKPVESFRVIFVKESGSTLSAEQTAIPGAKAIRDYLTAKTTPEGGLSGWREYDPQQTTANEQPTMRALWLAALPKLRPPPCVVVEVNGKADIIDLPANVTDALKILKSYGGH